MNVVNPCHAYCMTLPNHPTSRTTRRHKALGVVALAALLGACASGPGQSNPADAAQFIQSTNAQATPSNWQAPLPQLAHGGSLDGLAQFWAQWRDPVLLELAQAAQTESATLAAAASRLAQARATAAAAGAQGGPTLDLQGSAARARLQPKAAPATNLQAGLQAAWEIDLFGGNAAAQGAALARQDSAQAAWHDARVLVAAEVAVTYWNHRLCLAQTQLTEADTRSREATTRLTELTAKAGFSAPANADLAQASAAESRQRLTEQRAACDILVKQLVALSGKAEPELRQRLQTNTAPAPDLNSLGHLFGISALPAQVLAQRPDLRAAERDVIATSLDLRSSEADRLPRVSLAGNIGAARVSSGGFTSSGPVWSLGPIAITLPIFDGGRRAANVEAARARYEEASATYRAKLRAAVREVEEALIGLQSTSARAQDLQRAASGYRSFFIATEQRYKAGLASLVELEDARRTALAADNALLALLRDRIAAWVSLYRAAGGGFTPS
jgi:outer membrane protein, multidrug efflux system